MDSTNWTLVMAMSAAISAAFISGWLLHMMLSGAFFWLVLATSFLSASTGIFAPWCFDRQQRLERYVPTSNIFWATLLSVLINGTLVIGERYITQDEPEDISTLFNTDEFVRSMIAISGIGMALSLLTFLMHYAFGAQVKNVHRFYRRVVKLTRWAPKAKIVLCTDLETVAPGECAICLDALADLPATSVRLPPTVSKGSPLCEVGLLRLPCGHIFHSACAERWMTREVHCPMCRRPVGSMSKCTRLCLQESDVLLECHGPQGSESPEGGVVRTVGEDEMSFDSIAMLEGGTSNIGGNVENADTETIVSDASNRVAVVVATCHAKGQTRQEILSY